MEWKEVLPLLQNNHTGVAISVSPCQAIALAGISRSLWLAKSSALASLPPKQISPPTSRDLSARTVTKTPTSV
jgi:hypothetical protein